MAQKITQNQPRIFLRRILPKRGRRERIQKGLERGQENPKIDWIIRDRILTENLGENLEPSKIGFKRATHLRMLNSCLRTNALFVRRKGISSSIALTSLGTRKSP